jgi:hypothetical protein
MPKPIHEMTNWDASAHPSRPFADEEDHWEATRAQTGMATQLMRDKDEYLAESYRHVGRHVGQSEWELFVVIDPGEALQQQFETLQPEYIALHDVGVQSSRRMLAGLAAAAGRPVHKLLIRRQGLGMPLATIEFIELPCEPAHPPLRLYSTEVDADTAQRRRLARVLMGYSRLGVVMVGDLPPHALATSLLPLRDAISEGPWLNRELLMLPLAGAATLAQQASTLANGMTTLKVQTTPLVTRPAEAWGFLRGAWLKQRESLADDAIHLPDLLDPVAQRQAAMASAAPQGVSPAPATPAARAPLPLQPMPAARASADNAAPVMDPVLATYLRKCGELKGMLSCCVFELDSQRTLGHVGSRPGPAALASHGSSLMASMAEAQHGMHLGDAPPDAAVTFGAHHLILRLVPGRKGVALHAVLDKTQANLTLVRLQLQRLDLLLEEGVAE